jgi:uncharacterized protein (TIGR03435 family)
MRLGIDITGLEGQYEFRLTFAPVYPRNSYGRLLQPGLYVDNPDPAPSVFGAVKQYGLRLEPRKASLEQLGSAYVG